LTTFKFDAGNTGYAPDNTGPTTGVTRAWTTSFGSRFGGSVAVVDGTVYGLGNGGELVALDARSGETVWTTTLDGRGVRGGPTVERGSVYVGHDDTVYAVNARTGSVEWRADAGPGIVTNPVTVAAGSVYAVSDARGFNEDFDDPTPSDSLPTVVSAFNAANGRRVWRVELPETDAQTASPSYSRGQLHVGTGDFESRTGTLYTFQAKTGRENWTFGRPDGGATSPAVADGSVYFGVQFDLYAADARTGTQQWRGPSNGSYSASVPSVDDRAVYGAGDGGEVDAVDPTTGETLWTTRLSEIVGENTDPDGSPVIAGDTLFVTATRGDFRDREGLVAALDTADGSPLWVERFDQPVRSTPAVADGRVYVGTADGIVALEEP
ncbi:MAG: PQQ-binding-like beta-propeller repeat protein, partial [Halobaculum sp.]